MDRENFTKKVFRPLKLFELSQNFSKDPSIIVPNQLSKEFFRSETKIFFSIFLTFPYKLVLIELN
jgi:hypothetical protein